MEKLGVKLHRVRKIDYPCLKNEPYIWTLASEICHVDKKHNLDLIHANYAIPHGAAAFLAREQLKSEGRYLPYIVTGHGSDIHTNGKKLNINPILQVCLNQADGLTYVSGDLKDIAEKELGIKKKGVHIPNFVDTNFFRKKESGLRKKLGIPENSFVIGHVSNFAPIKQVNRFSYLAEHLKADGILNNIYFLMAGDGRDKTKLEERIEKIDAKEHFRFTGKLSQEELLEAYNSMDVLVLPSKHEGNPLTLLEAMACQVPVIGTNVGGISETIGKKGGFLVEDGGVVELLESIYQLKNNKELCKIKGREGLEKVKRKYSVDGIMDEYLKIYNSVRNKK